MKPESGRCPDCDCPNPKCFCVLSERLRAAERESREVSAERREARDLFEAAASVIAHNRTRIAKPRGADERRLLAYIDAGGAPMLGSFWSGRTDGWLKWLEARTVSPAPEQTSFLVGAGAETQETP